MGQTQATVLSLSLGGHYVSPGVVRFKRAGLSVELRCHSVSHSVTNSILSSTLLQLLTPAIHCDSC